MFQFSVVLLLSVILFLYGFFPITNNTKDFPNDPPRRIGNISISVEHSYRSHFQKTVLIVIDALRWDFATPELMPLSIGLMNQKGCISKVSVESPTVTLPRIKALTTGSVPQYIDVVKNLASSEILTDSWLHSARNKGLKTIFYGDNTWVKLFPDFFTRFEGTTSFFVWDFTEVDDNVTRNVDLELEREDWAIMIVHYLGSMMNNFGIIRIVGLDHIGHVLGPLSSKTPIKLNEMDQIVNKIYKRTNYTDTLILITGDHGMRDGGGHGGTSNPEVTVPLITIGNNCQNSSFLQTDIPANLAILLGLNIPSTSIGKIQKEFLNNLNVAEYLYALRYNLEILLQKKNLCRSDFNNATYFHEKYLQSNNTLYAHKAVNLYQNCSERITKQLFEASSKQDTPSLFLVVLILFNVLILLVLNLLNIESKTRSNWELYFYSFIILMQFCPLFDGILNLFLLISTVLAIFKLKIILGFLEISLGYSGIHTFLFLTCILHPITFISTSFIEEEHYFWMFLSVTLIILLFIQGVNQGKVLNVNNIKLFILLVFIRFSMDLNSTIENSVQNNDNWANILIVEKNHVYHQIFFAFSLVLVFFTTSGEQKTSEHKYILHLLRFFVLVLIFLLKSTPYHTPFLGKIIWGTVFLQKLLFKQFSWRQFWILSGTLLLKPYNIILIPIAVFASNEICDINKFRNTAALTAVNYMISNCFYFLQGHRNSLATVDISIGYTGLNDYYPFFVISQVLIHTYTFPVLFHLTVLQHLSVDKKQNLFWKTLLTLRTLVVLLTFIVMIIHKHHLFIWSVFAPKLFIECVHSGFLFLEICLWYFCNYVCQKIFPPK